MPNSNYIYTDRTLEGYDCNDCIYRDRHLQEEPCYSCYRSHCAFKKKSTGMDITTRKILCYFAGVLLSLWGNSDMGSYRVSRVLEKVKNGDFSDFEETE